MSEGSKGRKSRPQTGQRGFAMLLTDAVHAIETVGGVWLGISAVAFILLGLFVGIRRKSAAVDVDARRDGLAVSASPSVRVARAKKKVVAHKTPTRKAA